MSCNSFNFSKMLNDYYYLDLHFQLPIIFQPFHSPSNFFFERFKVHQLEATIWSIKNTFSTFPLTSCIFSLYFPLKTFTSSSQSLREWLEYEEADIQKTWSGWRWTDMKRSGKRKRLATLTLPLKLHSQPSCTVVVRVEACAAVRVFYPEPLHENELYVPVLTEQIWPNEIQVSTTLFKFEFLEFFNLFPDNL